MPAASARTLGDDDQPQVARPEPGLSLVEPQDRAAVLSQWERKIEQAERGVRFDRSDAPSPGEADHDEPHHGRFERRQAEPAPRVRFDGAETSRRDEPERASARPRARFERALPATATAAAAPVAQRRTITITGQPTPARRRPTLAERHITAQPDRIALWAFLLGLLLIAVAAGTAHA